MLATKKSSVSSVIVGCMLLVGLLVVQSGKQRQELSSKAAPGSGIPYISPVTINLTTGQQVPASIVVDSGVNQQVVVAILTFGFDPTVVSIPSCTAAGLFQGTAPALPCKVNAITKTIKVQVEAVNITGPTGVVPLVDMTLAGVTNGPATFTLLAYDVIVEDVNGDPIEYTDGNIGDFGSTTTPTVTTPAGSTVTAPTPTVTAAPTPFPTYNPSSTDAMIFFIIGVMVVLVTFLH